MTEMYADYIKEAWNREYAEWDFGFVTYGVCNKIGSLHICDLYIAPEYRGQGNYKTILNYLEGLARAEGLKFLSGDVHSNMRGRERSLMAQLKFGGWPVYVDENKVTLAKEIE